MAIVNGNPVNSEYTNQRLASKKEDNDLEGKQNLKSTDPDSGAEVLNAQKAINKNITDIADHEIRVTDAETTIQDHETRIGENESDITVLEGRVDQNEIDITSLQSDKIDLTEKGQANGVATLDSSGLVTSSQLPSYVDDVLEYSDLASFPVSGETGKIYVAIDTSLPYRWSGSAYVEISSGPATTDDLAEGSANQYFTESRVDSTPSVAANTAKVSFPEAPVDGNQYARKNEGWEQVESTGGGSGSSAKLIGGGNISWSTATNEVSFTSDLFLEFGGLDYSANTIPVSQSGFILNADQQVAYVTPNDSNPGGNLTVSVGALTVLSEGDIIIARREGDDLLIGDTTRVKNLDSTKLYSTNPFSGKAVLAKVEKTNTQNINSVSDVIVDWNISVFDEFALFDDANNYFVVQEKAKYRVKSSIIVDNLSGAIEYGIYINGTNRATVSNNDGSPGRSLDLNSIFELEIGDTVQTRVDSSSDSSYIILPVSRFNFFEIEKVDSSNSLTTASLHAQTISATAFATSSTTISTGGYSTPVLAGVESDDFSALNANGAFVAPRSGRLRVTSYIGLQPVTWNIGSRLVSQLFVNGGGSKYLYLNDWENTGTVLASASGSAEIEVLKGDIVDVRIFQTSGNNTSNYAVQDQCYVNYTMVPDFTIYGAAENQEYIETQLLTETVTTTANVYVDVIGSTTTIGEGATVERPQLWEVGYDISCLVLNSSGNLRNVTGSTRLTFSDNTFIEKTEGLFSNVFTLNTGSYSPVSRRTRISITQESDIKLRIRCGDSVANGSCRCGGESITSGLTDPDNNSTVWARRIR